jgi:hypothetical protein
MEVRRVALEELEAVLVVEAALVVELRVAYRLLDWLAVAVIESAPLQKRDVGVPAIVEEGVESEVVGGVWLDSGSVKSRIIGGVEDGGVEGVAGEGDAGGDDGDVEDSESGREGSESVNLPTGESVSVSDSVSVSESTCRLMDEVVIGVR